ncbi:UNVERIFIED_CONTAM: hypothetical protein K2H54_025136 [Gekko kuhli]
MPEGPNRQPGASTPGASRNVMSGGLNDGPPDFTQVLRQTPGNPSRGSEKARGSCLNAQRGADRQEKREAGAEEADGIDVKELMGNPKGGEDVLVGRPKDEVWPWFRSFKPWPERSPGAERKNKSEG